MLEKQYGLAFNFFIEECFNSGNVYPSLLFLLALAKIAIIQIERAYPKTNR